MASRYSFCYQFILDYFNFTKSASFVALECALCNGIFYFLFANWRLSVDAI